VLNKYINEYLKTDDRGIYEWARISTALGRNALNRLNRKEIVLTVTILLRTQLTAPIGNELLARYQAGIDNELYKAIAALRKHQEWRSKSMVTLMVTLMVTPMVTLETA
jgi:hypothetical protein